ncbi:MAG TPA: kelch repeat-containing protein, partial [Gemmatimonadales bacterium]|nr:kelch repeat-containing protein [Gemmatimonadales bacterium]
MSSIGHLDASAQSGVWSQFNPSGTRPSKRAGHAACYDSHARRLIIMGGETDEGLDSLVWALSLDSCITRWNQIPTTGGPPRSRKEHTIVYDPASNRVILFGGEAETFHAQTEVDTLYGDLWALNLNTNPATWSNITDSTSNTKPCPRAGHTAVVASNIMKIYAGEVAAGAGYTVDTFTLNMSTMVWGKVTP